jgi:hypothetical protein
MDEGFIWGDASVTYADWVGTAQLDERMTTPTIEDALGDQLRDWLVIGLDIGGGEHSHETYRSLPCLATLCLRAAVCSQGSPSVMVVRSTLRASSCMMSIRMSS